MEKKKKKKKEEEDDQPQVFLLNGLGHRLTPDHMRTVISATNMSNLDQHGQHGDTSWNMFRKVTKRPMSRCTWYLLQTT